MFKKTPWALRSAQHRLFSAVSQTKETIIALQHSDATTYQVTSVRGNDKRLRESIKAGGKSRKRWIPAKFPPGITDSDAQLAAKSVVRDRCAEFLKSIGPVDPEQLHITHWADWLDFDIFALKDKNRRVNKDPAILISNSGEIVKPLWSKHVHLAIHDLAREGFQVKSSSVMARSLSIPHNSTYSSATFLLQSQGSGATYETILVESGDRYIRSSTLTETDLKIVERKRQYIRSGRERSVPFAISHVRNILGSNFDIALISSSIQEDLLSMRSVRSKAFSVKDISTLRMTIKHLPQKGDTVTSNNASFTAYLCVRRIGATTIVNDGRLFRKCLQLSNNAIIEDHKIKKRLVHKDPDAAIQFMNKIGSLMICNDTFETTVHPGYDAYRPSTLLVKMYKENRQWIALVNGSNLTFKSGIHNFVEHNRKYDSGKGNRTPFEQGLLDAAGKLRIKSREGFKVSHVSDISLLKLFSHQPIALGVHDPARNTFENHVQSKTKLGVDDGKLDQSSSTFNDKVPTNLEFEKRGLNVPRPMLSHTLHLDKLDRLVTQSGIAFSQPKLDGIRCIAGLRTGELWSRRGKPILGLEYIEHTIRELGKHLTDIEWLDGEIYLHGMSFQKISSLARKSKGLTLPTMKESTNDVTMTKSNEPTTLTYHVFDCIAEEPFETRIKMLQELNWGAYSFTQLVSTKQVTIPQENNEILEIVNDVLHTHKMEGYEGSIWRTGGDEGYQIGKRSFCSLKFKEFDQEEFPCLQVHQRKYDEEVAGALQLALPDGRTFNASPATSIDDKRSMWVNRHEYTVAPGESPKYVATVKFQGFSDLGVPRFPVVVGFRHIDDIGQE